MTPSIHSGDVILLNKFYSTPKRFDIFSIDETKLNHNYRKKILGPYLKRIIGLPGDKLTFNILNGELIAINEHYSEISTNTVNDKLTIKSKNSDELIKVLAYNFSLFGHQFGIYNVPSKEALKLQKNQIIKKDVFNYDWLKSIKKRGKLVTFTIPDKKYFVLSDNRIIGIDSRHFGLVPEKALIGRFYKPTNQKT